MLQPVTAKELEYVVDSMSNEDLLMKHAAVLTTSTSNQVLKQLSGQMVQVHQQHYHTLMNCLQQHQPMAPTQPQN